MRTRARAGENSGESHSTLRRDSDRIDERELNKQLSISRNNTTKGHTNHRRSSVFSQNQERSIACRLRTKGKAAPGNKHNKVKNLKRSLSRPDVRWPVNRTARLTSQVAANAVNNNNNSSSAHRTSNGSSADNRCYQETGRPDFSDSLYASNHPKSKTEEGSAVKEVLKENNLDTASFVESKSDESKEVSAKDCCPSDVGANQNQLKSVEHPHATAVVQGESEETARSSPIEKQTPSHKSPPNSNETDLTTAAGQTFAVDTTAAADTSDPSIVAVDSSNVVGQRQAIDLTATADTRCFPSEPSAASLRSPTAQGGEDPDLVVVNKSPETRTRSSEASSRQSTDPSSQIVDHTPLAKFSSEEALPVERRANNDLKSRQEAADSTTPKTVGKYRRRHLLQSDQTIPRGKEQNLKRALRPSPSLPISKKRGKKPVGTPSSSTPHQGAKSKSEKSPTENSQPLTSPPCKSLPEASAADNSKANGSASSSPENQTTPGTVHRKPGACHFKKIERTGVRDSSDLSSSEEEFLGFLLDPEPVRKRKRKRVKKQQSPSTSFPSTSVPSNCAPSTSVPSTCAPSISAPSTCAPSTCAPSTSAPSTCAPSTSAPSTCAPSTSVPSTRAPSAPTGSGALSATALKVFDSSIIQSWSSNTKENFCSHGGKLCFSQYSIYGDLHQVNVVNPRDCIIDEFLEEPPTSRGNVSPKRNIVVNNLADQGYSSSSPCDASEKINGASGQSVSGTAIGELQSESKVNSPEEPPNQRPVLPERNIKPSQSDRPTAEDITEMRLQVEEKERPYRLDSLTWNPEHTVNEQGQYCYCGTNGVWYRNMVQCVRCLQWHHERCLAPRPHNMPIMPGDCFYVFVCSNCNFGSECLKRVPIQDCRDFVQLALFQLSLSYERKFHHVERDLLAHLHANWSLYQLARELFHGLSLQERADRVAACLLEHSDPDGGIFENGVETGQNRKLWSLRRLLPPKRPKYNLQVRGIVSERNVLDDLVMAEDVDSASPSAAGDVNAKMKRRQREVQLEKAKLKRTSPRNHGDAVAVDEPQQGLEHELQSYNTVYHEYKPKKRLDSSSYSYPNGSHQQSHDQASVGENGSLRSTRTSSRSSENPMGAPYNPDSSVATKTTPKPTPTLSRKIRASGIIASGTSATVTTSSHHWNGCHPSNGSSSSSAAARPCRKTTLSHSSSRAANIRSQSSSLKGRRGSKAKDEFDCIAAVCGDGGSIKACQVSTTSIPIPNQILGPVAAGPNSSRAGTKRTRARGGGGGDEADNSKINGISNGKTLLPFQIAKQLRQRRGFPRICVKYASIVPPKRQDVQQSVDQLAKQTQSGTSSMPKKKRKLNHQQSADAGKSSASDAANMNGTNGGPPSHSKGRKRALPPGRTDPSDRPSSHLTNGFEGGRLKVSWESMASTVAKGEMAHVNPGSNGLKPSLANGKVAKNGICDSQQRLLDTLIPEKADYGGSNNPFHWGSTEVLRRARNLLCTRKLEAKDLTKWRHRIKKRKHKLCIQESRLLWQQGMLELNKSVSDHPTADMTNGNHHPGEENEAVNGAVDTSPKTDTTRRVRMGRKFRLMSPALRYIPPTSTSAANKQAGAINDRPVSRKSIIAAMANFEHSQVAARITDEGGRVRVLVKVPDTTPTTGGSKAPTGRLNGALRRSTRLIQDEDLMAEL